MHPSDTNVSSCLVRRLSRDLAPNFIHCARAAKEDHQGGIKDLQACAARFFAHPLNPFVSIDDGTAEVTDRT